MWQALAGYAVRGPAQAALLSFSTLLLSLIFPPLVVVSNAIVALVWLRLGPAKGMAAVGIALVVATLIAAFSGNSVVPAALMMSFWLPVIVMAFVLRKTVSLDLALLSGGVLALVGVLITYLVVDQPSESWQWMVERIMEASEQAGGGTERPAVTAWLAEAGSWMTGFSAATQFVMAGLSLLLARVWQARMFNPGGLQKEFHSLRFGMTAGAAGLVIALAATFLKVELLTNLAIVVIVVFAFQGMAVLHALATKLKMHVLFMVPVYMFIVFLAPTSIKLIGLVGLVDTWLDFRSRLNAVSKSDD